MKFTVSREKLLKALQKVISTVGSKSTLPVLGNVLLEAENGTLQLTTTDLEIRITTQVEAAIESEGKTTVPAKKFINASRKPAASSNGTAANVQQSNS